MGVKRFQISYVSKKGDIVELPLQTGYINPSGEPIGAAQLINRLEDDFPATKWILSEVLTERVLKVTKQVIETSNQVRLRKKE